MGQRNTRPAAGPAQRSRKTAITRTTLVGISSLLIPRASAGAAPSAGHDYDRAIVNDSRPTCATSSGRAVPAGSIAASTQSVATCAVSALTVGPYGDRQ